MVENPSDKPDALLYDRFLSMSGTAIDAGLFEAAFHGLSAGLHCAEALGDIRRIREIERLADRAQRQIDRQDVSHRLASRSAADRGQQPVFRTLVVHAQAVTARIRSADAIASASRVSGVGSKRRGHMSDTSPREHGGTSTA